MSTPIVSKIEHALHSALGSPEYGMAFPVDPLVQG